MIRFRLFALVACFLVGCSSESDAIHAMENAGFTNVSVVDSTWAAGWAGCGQDDTMAYDVRATNSNEKPITALVCCGSVKRCTIRH